MHRKIKPKLHVIRCFNTLVCLLSALIALSTPTWADTSGLCAFPGDANDDGTLNLIDVLAVVNAIVSDVECSECCNVNDDIDVNLLDVLAIVDAIVNPNTCTCEHGQEASFLQCPESGTEHCIACDEGYILDGSELPACVVDPGPDCPSDSNDSDCPEASAQEIVFVSPPNGSRNVSRFPVISVSFDGLVALDDVQLSLVNRIGEEVLLTVSKSSHDEAVLVALPQDADQRLEPAARYFLNVDYAHGSASSTYRTQFETGGLKSSFCVERDGSEWVNSCNENYWQDDPAVGGDSASCTPPADPDASCTCLILDGTHGADAEFVIGGYKGQCTCSEETSFSAQHAVVTRVSPAPGESVALSELTTLELSLDQALLTPDYQLCLEDISDGSVTPASCDSLTLTTSTGTTLSAALDSVTLAEGRRYRATLSLADETEESLGDQARMVGPWAHRFSWTFQTNATASGSFEAMIPSARPSTQAAGVDFPTHLPTAPHLRFRYTSALRSGLADHDAPWFEVRDHSGNPVDDVFTWVDQDLHRLHLIIPGGLNQGTRYEVFCTASFGDATGDGNCTQDAIGRFLTEVHPPSEGTDDIREGAWHALQGDETWLSQRPTVLPHPYGYKERYQTDEIGPTAYLGSVMLLPPAEHTPSHTIIVDPSEGCVAPEAKPHVRAFGAYALGASACTSHSDCSPGYLCESTTARCKWDLATYRDSLNDFCKTIVQSDNTASSAPQARACTIQDAMRCAAGGIEGTQNWGQNRMVPKGAAGTCPDAYQYLTRCTSETSEESCSDADHCQWHTPTANESGACYYRYAAGSIPDTVLAETDVVNADSAAQDPGVIYSEKGTLWGCVPTGPVTIQLVGGEHRSFEQISMWTGLTLNDESGVHFDPLTHTIRPYPAPLTLEPLELSAAVRVVGTLPMSSPSEGLAIPVEPCHSTTSDGSAATICPKTRGVCDTSTWQCLAVASAGTDTLLNTNKGGEAITCDPDDDEIADCIAGFRCHESLLVCVIDGNHAAFSCTGGDTAHPEIGGTCTANWVQLDEAHNIWRIWWPHRRPNQSTNRYRFAARVGAIGATKAALPLLKSYYPNYPACDTPNAAACQEANDCLGDPLACNLARCERWNASSYDEQLADLVQRLAALSDDALPYGAHATGYKLEIGKDSLDANNNGNTEECTQMKLQSVSSDAMDGPQGLLVRLPNGATPSDYEFEGSWDRGYLAEVRGAHNWTIRGITFTHFAEAMIFNLGTSIALHGNQFIGAGVAHSRSVRAGDVTDLSFRDNYIHGGGTVYHLEGSNQVVTTNNLLWGSHEKPHIQEYDGDLSERPTICLAGDDDCPLPACREDRDCRIPFATSSPNGSQSYVLSDDPSDDGDHFQCENRDSHTGIGTCSAGLTGQDLFMDNIFHDTSGPNNSPYYRFRMQRNHFENAGHQESFDGSYGASYNALLDNVFFNLADIVANLKLTATVEVNYQSRNNAIDGNVMVATTPGWVAQGNRTAKIHPHPSSGTSILANYPHNTQESSGDGGNQLINSGLRIVNNTILSRPGAYEWGRTTGISLMRTGETLVSSNTVVIDSRIAISLFDDWGWDGSSAHGTALALTSGCITNNLALSAIRADDYSVNVCGSHPIYPFRKPSATFPTLVSISDNAVLTNDGDDGGPLLDAADLNTLFHEPIAWSPIIDYETIQRHTVADFAQEWEHMRRWPAYDPALLDDVLSVRSERAELTGYGRDASSEATCSE